MGMTAAEAETVFEGWQAYVEIADKLSRVFSVIPESFLPYPKNTLEEALNLVAKRYFESGDRRMAHAIQEGMAAWLGGVKNDGEAIPLMAKELELMLGNPALAAARLKNLQDARNSWATFKGKH